MPAVLIDDGAGRMKEHSPARIEGQLPLGIHDRLTDLQRFVAKVELRIACLVEGGRGNSDLRVTLVAIGVAGLSVMVLSVALTVNSAVVRLKMALPLMTVTAT